MNHRLYKRRDTIRTKPSLRKYLLNKYTLAIAAGAAGLATAHAVKHKSHPYFFAKAEEIKELKRETQNEVNAHLLRAVVSSAETLKRKGISRDTVGKDEYAVKVKEVLHKHPEYAQHIQQLAMVRALSSELGRLKGEQYTLSYGSGIGVTLTIFASALFINFLVKSRYARKLENAGKKTKREKKPTDESDSDQERTPTSSRTTPVPAVAATTVTSAPTAEEVSKKITKEDLSEVLKTKFKEHLIIAGILIDLRDNGVINEGLLRKVLKLPNYAKSLLTWNVKFVKPLLDEAGCQISIDTLCSPISERNSGNGTTTNGKAPLDYVTTEEALGFLGIYGSSRGIQPSKMHSYVENKGFSIIPARGGHFKITYLGETVTDKRGHPVMLVHASGGKELPGGSAVAIAKALYLFGKKHGIE